MIYSKDTAIDIMNQWGSERIPFLFVIDFEMQAIRLYRTDQSLPDGVLFDFSNLSTSSSNENQTGNLEFKKYPVLQREYKIAFDEVQRQILAGNSFLLNLTFSTLIETNLSLRAIYNRCRAKYKLLIDNEFLVFSPETFVTIKEGTIASFPMKGTIDAAISNAGELILNNPKETAEHHTIVDLIRNDLSIVASDVEVKRFRYIDTITTNQGELLQVSSEIAGKLPTGYQDSIGTILFGLLPAGSVTGAPKEKTVQIIRRVEKSDRGYYTGICGHFDGKYLDSGVMIRFIENKNGKLWFRSGGGITCNSNLNDEYNELIQKVYVPVV
jgi:para-aminobenzoate synthetase component I